MEVASRASVPRQLPRGIVEAEVVSDAVTASSSVTSFLILNLGVSIVLKGSINDLWSLFLILQLVAFMSIYETSIPANIEIFIGEFRKIVKFEIFQPDNFLGVIQPGLTLSSWL